MPFNLEDSGWRKTTCAEAKELSKRGYLVWWRPNMNAPSRTPDSDPALVMRVR